VAPNDRAVALQWDHSFDAVETVTQLFDNRKPNKLQWAHSFDAVETRPGCFNDNNRRLKVIVDAKKLDKAIKQCKKMDRYLHMKATGKILTLEAADEKNSCLIYQIIGDCEENFDVLIEQPSNLASIVTKAKKAGEIGITCEGDSLVLKHKGSSTTLKVNVDHGWRWTIGPRHSTENLVKIPSKALKKMARQALISVDKKSGSICYRNAIVICDEKKRFGIIGTNGISLSATRWPEPMQSDSFRRHTENWGGLKIAYKDLDIMKTAFGNGMVTLIVSINNHGQNYIEAFDKDCLLVLCEEDKEEYRMPPWDKTLEVQPKHIMKFQAENLLKAVDDSKIFSKGAEAPINLTFKEEQVIASCCTTEGKTEYIFPLEWIREREDDVISFNPKPLKAMLKMAKGEMLFGHIRPHYGGHICWFRPTQDWAYIVMPIANICPDCGSPRSPTQMRQCKTCGKFFCVKCQEARNKAGANPDLCHACQNLEK
jgi:DNA polymerase III sliding clamp (beta) subunit (PCNA family)